jgi:methylthioribose-1-phosphate isomerase
MMGSSFKTIEWKNGKVVLIDQRRLPTEELYLELTDPQSVAQAIRNMAIRGAPAIGIAAAMGIALGGKSINEWEYDKFKKKMEELFELFLSTRPTAINLRWAIERMKRIVESEKDLRKLKELLIEEAHKIYKEDIEINHRIGENGKILIKEGFTILTHCNAGALATAGYGTALGIIRSAHLEGKKVRVIACETRPFFQGSRLTAWELQKDGIPVTLITDSMAGHIMKKGEVNIVLVGADRIAANGDVANKIGTYSLAVLAREHGIPFFVAAPLSTFDLSISSGEEIPIEHRRPEEVTYWKNERIAPEGVSVLNPAFDITPNQLISAIINENGIIWPPYEGKIVG